MATSSELIQLRNRLRQVINAHDDAQGRTTVEKLQGIGVTQVPGLQYFTAGEVADLVNNRYIKKWTDSAIRKVSSEIAVAPGGSGNPANQN
jgi:hypothetical protein